MHGLSRGPGVKSVDRSYDAIEDAAYEASDASDACRGRADDRKAMRLPRKKKRWATSTEVILGRLAEAHPLHRNVARLQSPVSSV